MAEPNWRKIVDNLLERVSQLTLEHAAMKSLASDLETERDHWRGQVEQANATDSNNGDPATNGHGHGHETVPSA